MFLLSTLLTEILDKLPPKVEGNDIILMDKQFGIPNQIHPLLKHPLKVIPSPRIFDSYNRI
jgi:hypothetical protein